MRVLLAGPISAGDVVYREVEGYLAQNHVVNLNLHYLEPEQALALRQHYANNTNIHFSDFDPANPEALKNVITDQQQGYEAIIYPAGVEGFTLEVLDAVLDKKLAHRLKAIGCPNDAVGHLAAILAKTDQESIAILHVPGMHASAVAEYTFIQLGYHARGFDRFYDQTGMAGAWPHNKTITESMGLTGKTLGVLGGSGKDGGAVIAKAIGNGMRVIAMGSGSQEGDGKIRMLGAEVAASVDEIISRADFISINCRSNSETKDLIGEPQLAAMNPGVVIINPAGAEIINKQALLRHFEKPAAERKITVILDMPYGGRRDDSAFNADPDNARLKANGVLFTPRMAGYTVETQIQAVEKLTADINLLLRQNYCVAIANKPAGIELGTSTINDEILPQVLEDLLHLMRKAGENAKQLRDSNALDVVYLSDGSPTTNADMMASEMIQKGLQKKGYNFRFSGEELIPDASVKTDVEVVIDGIDGTRNFRDGNYGWCISAAIQHKGETIAGAIHDPQCGETFWAIKDKGAYMRNSFSTHTLNIPESHPQDFSFSVGSFRIKGSTIIKQDIIADIKTLGGREREWGSVALSICAVARGGLSVFIQGSSKLHDNVAGVLIAQEAGAAVINSPALEPDRSDIIVVHPNLRDKIEAIYKNRSAGLANLVSPAKELKKAADTGITGQ